MKKGTNSFILRLVGYAGVLFLIHFYIIQQFFDGSLYFPIWTIYVFNAILVFAVYSILVIRSSKGSKKLYHLFLGLTIAKMALAIVFLLPLFFGKSSHAQLEVINFFVPYFLFLIFEIFSLNKILQKG